MYLIDCWLLYLTKRIHCFVLLEQVLSAYGFVVKQQTHAYHNVVGWTLHDIICFMMKICCHNVCLFAYLSDILFSQNYALFLHKLPNKHKNNIN